MKKTIVKILTMALCLVFSMAAFGGCYSGGGGGGNNNEVPDQVDTSDRSGWVERNLADPSTFLNKTLNIMYFKGGYGDEWLKEMETKFEADYPGIDVVLKPSTDASQFQTLLEQKLQAPNTPDDIYICHDIPWQYLSSQGLIADLTNDLYGQTIYYDTNRDNLAIKFQDLVATSSLPTAMYNNKFYKVPLIQGVGGIAYNKTLFDKYGWEVPETYEELETLCETIYNSNATNASGEKVYPFVFSGTESYLWDGMINAWWMQLAGEEEYERGWNPGKDDMDVYNPEVYPYHKDAYQAWYDLVCVNKSKYVKPGSEGLTYLEADMAFAAGQGGHLLDFQRDRRGHEGKFRLRDRHDGRAHSRRSEDGRKRQPRHLRIRHRRARFHRRGGTRQQAAGRRIPQMAGVRTEQRTLPQERGRHLHGVQIRFRSAYREVRERSVGDGLFQTDGRKLAQRGTFQQSALHHEKDFGISRGQLHHQRAGNGGNGKRHDAR